MNTLEILTAARAKISEEKNWCQGYFAKDSRGRRTGASNNSACSWCSVGSLRSMDYDNFYDYQKSMNLLSEAMGCSVPDYNDSHTHTLKCWQHGTRLLLSVLRRVYEY